MTHILVFDSGVGGLSVVDDIRRLMPDLALDYVADDAFRPYGNKSAHALDARLPELLSVLVEMLESDLVVIACNTASTTALPAIRAALSVPVIGVVPAIKPAARDSQTRHIGVLGTPGTVRRAYVDQLIEDFASNCNVTLKGSVALVGMAEDKLIGKAVSQAELAHVLEDFKHQTPPIDHIVLACTHFPLLKDEMSHVTGEGITWVDSGAAIARRVKTLLRDQGLISQSRNRDDLAFTTGQDIEGQRQAVFAHYGFAPMISLFA